MSTLSVTVITKNEQENIERCLQSVQWADEIIVLDSGSTDDTVTIAKRFTPQVFVTDWPGYGQQKQRALGKAKCTWVLSLDADEWLSEKLQKEIQQVLASKTDVNGFWVSRKSYFCGKLIRFGLWRHDKVLRLFQRETGHFSENAVHEKLLVEGKHQRLKQHLLHDPCHTMADAERKNIQYAMLQAKSVIARGKVVPFYRPMLRAVFTFLKGYLFRLGFLDGKQGLWLAFATARYTYLKYHLARRLSS